MSTPYIRLLPVTPAPGKGEHLASYLVRLAEKNGLQSPTRLASRLMGDRIERAKLRLRFEPAKLAALTGHDVGSLFTESSAGSQGMKLRGLGDIRIGRPLCSPMWCFACVHETGYVEVPWQFAPVTACYRHGTRGNSRCPGCDVPLAWERGSLSTCTCGTPLRTDDRDRLAEPEDVAFSELVARVTLGYRDLPCAERLKFPVSELEGASVGSLCRLVLVLGTLAELPAYLDAESEAQIIRRGISLLAEWPVRLHSALADGVSTKGPDLVHSLFEATGLLGRDRRRMDDYGICYRVVADAVFAYLDATGPWNLDARLTTTALGGRKFHWQTQSQTLADIGSLTRGKLNRLVDAGLLTPLTGSRYRRYQRPSSGLDIGQVDFIRYREAVEICGLPLDTFHFLRKSGAFAFVGAISRYGMTRHQAQHVRRVLDAAALAQPAAPAGSGDDADTLTVGACLASNAYARTYKHALISQLLEGWPIASSPQASFLLLRLLPAAVGQRQVSSPDAECGPDGWLGMCRAGEYLGCSTKTIRQMISSGQLRLAEDAASRHPRVALRSLKTFSKRYQSVRDVADALGVTSNCALGRLQKRQAAALLSVGPGTTPFIRRSGLPPLATLI